MIQVKEKPCKGIGKAKGHGCGKTTMHRIHGLGKMCGCYSDWLLNSEAGKIKLEKARLKAIKPRKDLERARVERKSKESLMWLINSTITACHNYIKARDKHKPCISCQEPWHSDFHAGHFYKAELFTTIKFHEHNINGQCPGCNIYKSGNESQYRVNLPLRIGEEAFNEINRLALLDKQIDFKYDRQTLIETRKYYKDKLKSINHESK